jgi:hypothetical protein
MSRTKYFDYYDSGNNIIFIVVSKTVVKIDKTLIIVTNFPYIQFISGTFLPIVAS